MTIKSKCAVCGYVKEFKDLDVDVELPVPIKWKCPSCDTVTVITPITLKKKK